MKTKDFLQTVLGDEGYYCIWAKNYTTGRYDQHFYPTIDDAVAAAFDKDEIEWNAFFALSTFKTDETRAANNVQWVKAFFFDLDCGEGKEFPSQSVAIKDLQAFCKRNKLPQPTMVNSGNGVHVYWPLKEQVCREDWQPVADRLKKLCVDQGFPVDPSRTADAASILRVPNTHNYKKGNKKKVEVLGVSLPTPLDFDEFATAVGGGTIPVPKIYVPRGPDPVLDALAGSSENKFSTLIRKTVEGKGCAQIAHIIKNQDTMSEPLWRAGLSIAINCVDGDKAIHNISRKHPEYSEEDTVRKAERLIDMPYRCTKFDEFNPDVCANCPLFGKIGSPISLAREFIEATEEDNEVEIPAKTPFQQPATVQIPEYPAPYYRGKGGGVFILMPPKEDDEGEPEPKLIYHNDFYVTRRMMDPELGEMVSFALHMPRDGVREFVAPLSNVTSREEFRKTMAMNGIVLMKGEVDLMQAYVSKWINKLQYETNATNAHLQFGWVGDTYEEFVLGERVIGASGNDYNPPSSKLTGLVENFTCTGSRDRQLEMINFYDKPNFELHQFIIGTGYGSPLMRITGMGSLAVHMWGGSGVGKTTAMYLATGLAGDPEKLTLDKADTHNSRMNRAERYKDLPLPSDEMTDIDKKGARYEADVSDYVYQIVNGRQKNRLASNGNTERFRGEPWSFIALSTGNTSMWDLLVRKKATPIAEMQRLFEIRVDKLIQPSDNLKETTDEMFRDSKLHYGWLMEEYIRYVINNKEEVETTLRQVQRKIDKAAGLDQPNRFWSAGCAAILTGLIYARKIGHISYNLEGVYKWTVAMLRERKAFVDDIGSDVESIITDYMSENYGSFLRIDSGIDLRKGDDPLMDATEVLNPDRDAGAKLVGRYEPDTNKVYLLRKPLRDWMTDRQLNYSATIGDAMKELNGKVMKKRLTAGTSMAMPAVDVVVLQLTKGVDG